jgi:hypothetical protein
MFDTLNLLTLILAPFFAYVAGAMMFFVYELLHRNSAQPIYREKQLNSLITTHCPNKGRELLV